MISTYTRKGICQVLSDAGWETSRINALFVLGFTYADVVLLSGIHGDEGKRYAIKCTFAPLQTYLASFLAVFGWTESDGILYSPENPCLGSGDLIAVIANSREAFVSQANEL
jgi:hypothetical protein